MFTFKTVDNTLLSFFSNMQLLYSTNVVLGATPRTCPVGPSCETSLKPLAVAMCPKPESPFLPRWNLNLDTRRCYTYSSCRSQKPPRPAPLPVLAQHGACTAPYCLGSRSTRTCGNHSLAGFPTRISLLLSFLLP